MKCILLTQWRFQNSSVASRKHDPERQQLPSSMHAPYVPGSSSLACEGELQGVLACQDCDHEFQLHEELLDLDPRCTASESQQRNTSF